MVALVTGGGRGIGRGITEKLLEKGYTVIVASRNKTDYISEMEQKTNGKVDFVTLDISDTDSIKNMFATIKQKYSSLDLLVNNAGVAPKTRKDILQISPDDFSDVVDTNLKGTFFVTQNAVEMLTKNEKSRIVNISSMSSYTASVNRGEYCISKAGISMVTKLFAIELAEKGVSVLEIQPGIIESDMTSCVKEKYDKMIAEGITPIKRMGKPEDIAKCVGAIAMGDFDFCTGTVICCDGGFSVRSL